MKIRDARVYTPRVKILLAILLILISSYVLYTTFNFTRTLAKETGISLGDMLKPIDGRVNVLLLGIGGEDHDGADLTDTMIVLSMHIEQKKIAMISLPRDIWSDTLKDKINSAYHYGNEKKENGGLTLAKAITSDVVGLPIHYGVVFDFSGFVKIVDSVGGVDVDIQQAFVDTKYPLAGRQNDTCNGDTTYACRYETLVFETGRLHMDGETALKYVRSRHAQGQEGTDFSRGRRQQEVLFALKEKVTQKNIYLNITIVKELSQAIKAASETDMTLGEMLSLGKHFLWVQNSEIVRISLEDQLYAPPNYLYGRYVLLPKESFEAIHTTIKNQLP